MTEQNMLCRRALWTAFVAALLVASTGHSAVADQKRVYACLAVEVRGFSYKENLGWQPAQFKERRFTLTFDGQRATIKKSGPDLEQYVCSRPYEKTKPALFQCVERMFFLIFD